MTVDDLGTPVRVDPTVQRVVSLVPSLTEAIAETRRELLVGATDWCSRPADLEVVRVRGTKNPDIRAVVELRPDLVVANVEENRELDVRRLRASGVPVWVTRIEDVDSAIESMSRLITAGLRLAEPEWLADAREVWGVPAELPPLRVVVAVWRDPWMVVGRDTYAGDMLSRLGLTHVYRGDLRRYPTVGLASIDRREVDLVLLPDEPYPFSHADGPAAFRQTGTSLIEGRLLTWYGPTMVGARQGIVHNILGALEL